MNDLGAFVPHAGLGDYGPGGSGPLAGVTLAVKDLFDVAGLVTGAGSPAWAEGRPPATTDAPAVAALRAAGARIVGKTITDELAWSLNGENAHYGTPENPAAPGHIPGGSSAGSASAVAGRLADLALGTDTGGSVRLPASFCGLWGLRPTHGRIPMDGCVPLAPSYDTVGWFARDPALLARAGSALLTGAPNRTTPARLLIATDLFERVDPAVADALSGAARNLAGRLGLTADPVTLAPKGVEAWRETFRVCQSAEVWHTHGAWVTAARPAFGPGIAERFAAAAALDPAEIAAERANRDAIRTRMQDLLGRDALLIVPGAGSPPPSRGLSGPALDEVRGRALDVLCPAGHAGLPQLALPAISTADGPVGLGLVGPAGSDEMLLELALRLRIKETAT